MDYLLDSNNILTSSRTDTTTPVKFSSRNMGKNDLCIAATASAVDLQLVTMDKDFNHLTPSYINLLYVEIT
jgi:tRNA(fMet)-specific endonuclease VapC